MSKNIIITGALGHIGSELIRRLPDYFPDDNVIMIDNLLTQRYCSLFNLPTHGHYSFIEKDIFNVDFDSLLNNTQAIIHLAAITNAPESVKNKQEVEKINFEGTKHVAQKAAKHHCPFIYISTTSVYGSQSERVDENCPESELKPQSPYAQSKFDAEKFLLTLSQLPFITMRFGTIFGPSIGMRFHTAINKFCWQAVFNEPLSVWQTAYQQYRPYLDLTDAIKAIIFTMKNNIFNRQVYNVLTTNVTVENIVDMIKKKIPSTKVNFVSSAIMNQLSYHVDKKKFENQGFSFKGSLEKGIYDTIDYISQANNVER